MQVEVNLPQRVLKALEFDDKYSLRDEIEPGIFPLLQQVLKMFWSLDSY